MSAETQKKRFLKPHLLVVEGDDELEFFTALLRELSIPSVQIYKLDGKSGLRVFLKTARGINGFDDPSNRVVSIGIIQDADHNPRGAFDSICSALRSTNFPVPHQPLAVAPGDVHVSVLILPDAHTPGMLEDLVLKAVQDEPAYDCAAAYFECLGGLANFKPPKNPAKARVMAYLASKPETVPHLGIAAHKHYWSLDHPVFDEVKRFLIALVA